MIAIPAVDVRDGACVQLVGGSYTEEKIRVPEPAAVARAWAQLGFSRLHLVDLDAATGRGSNASVVEEILRDEGAEVQVGGGVRSTDAIEHLYRAGAKHVVVGTRAVEDPDWLADVVAMYPGLIIVATDVRERSVVTRGWARTLPVDVLDVVESLNAYALGGLLVTAVHLEGQMRGADLALMEDVAEISRFPVIASGGVANMHDLRALEHRGVSGAVIGMDVREDDDVDVPLAQEFAR